MNTVLVVAGIYLAGWVITFRLDAWHSITRRNMRRDEAIRKATFPAAWWPIAGLALVALCVHTLITAGLPKSQADRDAELAELEREALGDVLETGPEPMQATADNSDAEVRRLRLRQAGLRDRHRRKGHPASFAACPECWPMLP